MKCSHFWRLVSAIVAFAMLIQLIPVRFPHFANAVTTEDTIEGNTTIILGEVESLREEDTKHFRLSNGSYIAVSYGMPVHYEGEDGNWEDIDNTIVENSNTNTYQLNRTDTVVAFANALTNGTVLTTSVDDKTITMSLLDTSQAVQMIVGEETETVTGVEEAVAETEPEETIPEIIAAVVEDETQVTVAETESDDAVFAVDETVVEETEEVVAESAETQTVEETTASTIPEETEAPTIPEETTMPTVPEETEAVTEPEETVPEITSAKIGSIGEMDAVAVVTPIVSGGVTFDRAATAEIATEISTMLSLQESESWNVEDIIPEKLQSSLLYENVFPDTDLLYTAFGHNIKEQIIVNKPQNAYRYDFLLNLDGMTADLNEDGSVSIVDTENNVIYKIPVPYMEDGGGSVSYDVAFTLNEVDSGLIFTVEADTEWINAEEREFPVKIDPSFVLEAGRAYDDIYSVYTMEDDPNTVTMGRSHLYVGAWNNFSSSDGRYRIFMHFNDMPQIPDGSEVVNAQMSLCQFGYEKPARQPLPICYSFPAGVYEVTTDRPSQYSSYEKWFEAITWRKMPSYDASNVIDYCILDSTASWRTWNITELVKKWYVEDTDNTTVALAMINEEDIDRTSYFASAKFYAYGSTYPPILIVSYRNNTGIEPYYTYATLGGVSAGTAYVADATGQLKVGKEITGFASSVNPFSLNLVYNSDYFVMNAGTDYQPPSKLGLSMNIGSGWTMNYIQKVVPETIDGIDYLKYTDGDGTIHYFMKDSTPEDSSYPYYDEDGLSLKMRVNSTNNYTMADDAGSTWIFTNNYLTSIKDGIGNEIKVNFSDGKITSITQKNNGCSEINLTVFEYEGNYLKTVTDYAENIYTLNYTGSNLTSIQKNSTTVAVYTYDGYRLTKMTDSESGYSLVFTYKDGKISSYKEMGGTSSGAIVAVSYPSHSQTTYRDYGIDRTANTPDDILTHYLFDYAGRTANAYTTDNTGNVLGATNAAYYDGEETIDKRNNRTIRSASIGVAGQQLLKDTSLEGSDNSWTFSETSKSTTHPRTGVYSIKGELSSDGTQYAYRASETLKAGTTYTLSAYVNASNITSTEGEGICLSVSDGTNTWKSNPVNYVTSLDVDDGWVRISVTFTAETDGPHTVGIYNNSAIGTFYADDFQLEKGEAPSSYNLIENGSMEMSNYGWTMGTGAAYSSVKAAAGSVKSLLINGDPESRSTNAYQEVSLNMPGSQTYVLSGWVHANAVPDDDEDANNTTDTSKECGLRAIITYSDGTTETHYASFNADISNAWQFVSTTLVPKQPLKTVSKIRVVCAYEGNANKAYFDNISLLREAAQTMTYDEDGNLTSVTSTGLSADTNVYDDGNLIKVITGGNGSYTYTYDTTYEHRLNSVTNGLITQTMGYDDVGNVTSTSLSGTGTKKIATSVTYDESGNRQTSVTDAAGNTVEYLYGDADSEMLGLPTAVIDPKDTATTTIYDENGRVGKTGIGNLASLLYTYSEGNLSSVLRADGETDTQTYSFTYDGFGNMLSAKVGNRTLASYTYSLGNGLMTDQVFGNGDAISFTYDDLGRIRTVTYDDGRIVTYVYNGEGNLHSVTETGGSNSVSYLYLYDDLGRMISSERKENGNSALRTHQSYNENNQLTEQAWQMGDNSHSESYTYNESDGSLKEVTTSEGATTTYTYDSLRRLSQSTTRNGNTPIIKDIYTYRDISDTDTTLQVETKQVTAYSVDTTYTYQYDVNGNITAVDTVWENPLIKNVKTREAVSYVYDAQNQLIRENNQVARRTWVWEYDHVGNILSRKEYYYTTGTLGTPISTVTYGYGDSDWGDLLTLYDGNTITYDTIGNPLSDGIWNYTWTNGRQLASMSDGETTWNYTYDAGGLRTSRSDGTTTYKYIYSGDKLVRMTAGDDVLCFTYDANGYPESVTFNGDVFYYVTNLQGDVTWITNSIGRAVVKYNYDAWGNLIATDGMNAELQELNPLRYRGYVYDGETGLYYLQSRYYNPEMGRFLNVDSYASTGTNIIGNNMFAYCNNAPMFYSDHSGKCPHNGRFYMSGPFSGQFEYDSSCTLCAAHGEFCLVSSSGAIINMMMSNEQKVLVATIAAEATVTAAGKNVSSQGRQAMANVALNRVGQREWSQHYSVSEICQYTGFDGYGTAQYWSCMNYLNNRDGNNAVYEEIIWDVLAAYNYDITGGCQLYYTPAAMAIPGSTPNWNFSFLEEVCIPGVDSYYEGRFFKYR